MKYYIIVFYFINLCNIFNHSLRVKLIQIIQHKKKSLTIKLIKKNKNHPNSRFKSVRLIKFLKTVLRDSMLTSVKF